MITSSAISLIKKQFPKFAPTIIFREKSLNGLTKKTRHSIVAPGFSVSNNTYPSLFPLFDDLDRMEYFFPIGCSYQSPIPYADAFKPGQYNKITLEFLRGMAERFGPFPCRDQLIADLLTQHKIPAFLMCDLVLFDDAMIGRDLNFPEDIRSIAISLQHHTRYLEQVIDIMKLVRRRFTKAKCYVTLQSAQNNMYKIMSHRAEEIGFETVDLSGPAINLEFYNQIDLHIGYRLHGHVYFLRKRKPSILLVEDCRSYGFSRTSDLNVGCIDAYDSKKGEPDDLAPAKAMAFLDHQLSIKFADYEKPLALIDHIYSTVVSEHFNILGDKLQQ